MKKKMMRWLMGLLSMALVAGNLTYVSAGGPDVDATDSRAGSVSGSDHLQADVSGADTFIPGNDASVSESDTAVHENDVSVSRDDVPVAESGTSIYRNEADVPENNSSVPSNDAIVTEHDTSVSGNDVSVLGNDAPTFGNDAGEMPLLLDSDAPWTLDSVEITFSRQYQALMLNPFGQYYCVDFDECPEAECDILFGSKYAKASDLDIYVYSDYQGSWVRCSFNGWELVAGAGTYTIQETSYTEENHAIKQYDPRTYEYDGRTYWLEDADLVISGTMSKDPAVWGDDEYHGVSGGCYWFADEGLLIVSGEMLSTPKINVVSPAYQADRILYTNYYVKQAGILDEIRTVCLDGNITEIGNWAFAYCKGLEKVVIDGTVVDIGESAFFGCTALQEIGLKDGLEHIGNSAFFNCSSLDVDWIPDTVSYIGNRAFNGTAVTNIRIPDAVDTIEEYTFGWCKELKTVDLNQAAVVKNNAFNYCSQLTLTEFPDSVIAVGDEAFYQCPYVVIGELPGRLSDENIGENAFLIPYTVIRYLIDFDFGNSDGYIPDNPDKVLASSTYKGYYDPSRTVADAFSYQPLQRKYGYVVDGRVRCTYGFSYPECNALTEEEIYGKFMETFGDRITAPSPDNFVCLGYAPYQDYGADGAYHEYTFMGTANRVMKDYGSELTDKVEPSRIIYLYYRNAASVTELSGITAEYTGGEVAENGRISKEDITVRAAYTTTYESGAKRTSYRSVSADEFAIDPETAALGENQVAVFLSEKPDVSFPFPDIIFNCYDPDAVPDYLWAWVRSYHTDSGRNYLDDGQHGEEMGESLQEITKMADVVVIGVNKAETRRYQTGIEASYPRLSQMEGSGIVQEDITVYPLYTIEYNDGTKEENVRGDTPLAPEEYETDRQTVEKGGNTITVTSGGFEDFFEVFGNHKDGIIAEYPRNEEVEGTVLDKDDFTVFYTYTMMDPDSGEMAYHVPDRDAVVGSFRLDEDVIHLGSNTITVTETDDDAAWTDSVGITGTALQVEPDPDPEPTPDPDPEPTPDPDPEPTPDPDPEPTPDPDPEPTPDPDPEPTPDPDLEPTPDPDPEPTPDPDPEPTPDPDPEPIPDPDPEPTPDPDPEPTPDPEPEPTPDPKPELTPDPEPEPTPDPGHKPTPDSEPEPIPDSTPEPDSTRSPELEPIPDPAPGEGEGTIPTWEPVSPKTGYCPKLRIALAAGSLAALLTALGAYILFLLLSRRRKRFCGILTDESVDGIKIKPYREPYALAQDVIDRSASLEECVKELQKSGDFTYLPNDTLMSVHYTSRAGMPVRTDKEADEKAMYEILEELEGCGRVEVALYDGENFEITLIFHL